MTIDGDKLLLEAIRDGFRESLKTKLGGYNSPFEKLVGDVITAHSGEFRSLLEGAIASCMRDAVFAEDVRSSVRSILARQLVQKFGGELEKQVNVLKSDPTTRARITLAIEEIVKQKAS